MTTSAFHLILRPPPELIARFLHDGWVGWRTSLGLGSDQHLGNCWKGPEYEEPAQPCWWKLADKRYTCPQPASLCDGKSNWLWLARRDGLDFPNQIALTYRTDKSVWRLDPAWNNHLGLSSGGFYKLLPSGEAGGIMKDATFEFAAQEQPDKEGGWISPLHLRCGCDMPMPATQGVGQGEFWKHVLENDDAILDLIPEFPDSDGLRVQFYARAARQLDKAKPASAIQRLVFGPDRGQPNPLWFLILDGLNGEFRLTGFPAEPDSKGPKWIWLRPDGLDFFQNWLAEFACRKARLDCHPKNTSGHPQSCVPPNGFKNFRELYSNRSPRTLPKHELDWNRLGILLADDGIPWQRRMIDAANDAKMELNSALDGCLSTSHDGTKISFDAAVVVRFLSARHLLPRSPVRVILPPVPGCLRDADRDDWQQNVTGVGLFDLKESVLWPEWDWPEGLLNRVESLEEVYSWNALSPDWHRKFYDALYTKSFSVRLKRWEYRHRCVLGRTPIKSFRLGSRRPGARVYPFALP